MEQNSNKLLNTNSPEKYGKGPPSPLDKKFMNPFSYIFFSWLDPIVWKGFRTFLNSTDIFEIPQFLSCEYQYSTLNYFWKKNYSKMIGSKHSKDQNSQEEAQIPSKWKQFLAKRFSIHATVLWISMLQAYWRDVVLGGIFMLLRHATQLCIPYFIYFTVNFIKESSIAFENNTTPPPLYLGILYSFGIFFLQFLSTLFLNHCNFITNKQWVKMQAALSSATFRKMLRLSNRAKKQFQTGQVVNLMSHDSQVIGQFVYNAHIGWSFPLYILIASANLYIYFGWVSLAGALIMILLIPASLVFGSIISKVQNKMSKIRDERIKIMNEVLQGIRLVKYYVWEKKFYSTVKTVRDKEIRELQKSASLQSLQQFTSKSLSIIAAAVTFSLYAILFGNLESENVFAGLSVFGLMNWAVTNLPEFVTRFANAKTSVERVSAFLCAEELDSVEQGDPTNPIAISMIDCTFSWNGVDPTLDSISIDIERGKLIAITGRVTSGKSSFLQACFGDISKIEGIMNINGNIAYCDQNPWIINATIRENILFGLDYDEQRYERVVTACQLKPDFANFTSGDLEEIGERGVNISGGQKARLSLARACYQNRDIYLLDSVLNAVDAHVQGKLFKNVIQGLLKDKTVLLVTHSVQAISKADLVMILQEGKINNLGSYKELRNKGINFTLDYEVVDDVADEQVDEEVEVSHIASSESATKTTPTQIIVQEDRKVGSISNKVLLQYFKGCGFFFFLSLGLVIISKLFEQFTNSWLSVWTSNILPSDLPLIFYLIIYNASGLIASLLVLFKALSFAFGNMKSTNTLHFKMLQKLLRAPMRFYDQNPVGRILNRVGKDQFSIDYEMMMNFNDIFSHVVEAIGIFIIIIIVNPLFLIAAVPILAGFFTIQQFFRFASRETRRLESISRSPAFAHFSTCIVGAPTIRAYQLQNIFIRESDEKLDFAMKHFFLRAMLNRWLGLRLEAMSSFIAFFTALSGVLMRAYVNASFIGLGLNYSVVINTSFMWIVIVSVMAEANLTSCERISAYCSLEEEYKRTNETVKPPADWPHQGEITISNLKMKYRKELDYTLKGVNMHILPREKVAIVGRTGSGKSSLTSCLLRMVEPEEGSKIEIDGINVLEDFSLEDLRSRIIIVPQDAVLFSGTIRSNIDPFDEFTDPQIWDALERTNLKDLIEKIPNELYAQVSESGTNLSSGFQQLVCLARSLLYKAKIIIMDEASSQIDSNSDYLLRKTIQEQFKDCTCITIAHRLLSIAEFADKVAYMENGEILEFDTPHNLLANPESHFYKLVHETGTQEASLVKELVLKKVQSTETL